MDKPMDMPMDMPGMPGMPMDMPGMGGMPGMSGGHTHSHVHPPTPTPRPYNGPLYVQGGFPNSTTCTNPKIRKEWYGPRVPDGRADLVQEENVKA
jgi:hypothetical protein